MAVLDRSLTANVEDLVKTVDHESQFSPETILARNAVEGNFLKIENMITEHHGTALYKWCSEQNNHFNQAADLDHDALEIQRQTTKDMLTEIRLEADRQNKERLSAKRLGDQVRLEREREFTDDLESIAEKYAEANAEVVRECTSKVRAIGEAWDANAWDKMDRQLGAVAWQQARMVHAANPTAGVADVYTCGALNPYLDSEKEGWSRSQQNDLDRLISDVANEGDAIFLNLQRKLKSMAPEAILVKPWIEKLEAMVNIERDRLKALEREALSTYDSEVEAATWQCSEDYHGYDSELQKILVRCLEERCESLSQGRQLKLALCNWRLDYQTIYIRDLHLIRTESGRRSSNANLMGIAKETGPRRFTMVRRLLRRLWEHGDVPYWEIHRFLKVVSGEICRCQHVAAWNFAPLYRQAIEQYGAGVLIDKAKSEKVLDLWMQAIVLHKKPKSEGKATDGTTRGVLKRGTGFFG